MDRSALLSTNTAHSLYETVKDLPIVDYHNHLSLADLRANTRFTDLYELWIKPDPYKHRAMRMCGVEEERITGSASDFEKFEAWCGVYPRLIGSPLYIWTQMELQSVLGITELPCKENAKAIYDAANLYLREHTLTPERIFEQFKVEFACPCVSAADELSVFQTTSHVAPSLRGDDVALPSLDGIKKLETLTHPIASLDDYKDALSVRLDALQKVGCKFSDHALDNGFVYLADDGKNDARFAAVRRGEKLSDADARALCSYLLTFLCGEYAKRNMTVQLHIGAQRFTSTRL